VEELAKKDINTKTGKDEYGVSWIKHPEGRPPYVMLVPLLEILSETLETTSSSQKVYVEYEKLTKKFGGEFNVLLQTKSEDIENISGPLVREAIDRVRRGDIFIDPGFDGEFGKVRIWKDRQEVSLSKPKVKQMGLF
jgi:PHP family Zn ribbon phosphoesterase